MNGYQGIHLVLRKQVNANRTYFYPDCEASRRLLHLMKRKALVKDDREALESFLESVCAEHTIEIVEPTPKPGW